MKTTRKLTIFVITFLALATTAYAQTPREQLNQMVEQLQKSPNDNALREKVIKLGAQLRPAVPAEAERRMVRGSAAFKSATSAAGYQEAAKEFEQATLAAPWYGDAYFNLGVAQDKAGNHEAALRSLKLAQMASPGSKEITNLIYEVEYRNEKARSPQEQEAALLKSLNGAIFSIRLESADGESSGEEQYQVSDKSVVHMYRHFRGAGLVKPCPSQPISAGESCSSGSFTLSGRSFNNGNRSFKNGNNCEIKSDGQSIVCYVNGYNDDTRIYKRR